jgi:hypothetical protein
MLAQGAISHAAAPAVAPATAVKMMVIAGNLRAPGTSEHSVAATGRRRYASHDPVLHGVVTTPGRHRDGILRA